MDLDATDREILEMLKANGREPYRKISERVGVTAPTVKSRIDKMMDNGVIEGYTVELDRTKIVEGYVAEALITVEGVTDDAVEDMRSDDRFTDVKRTLNNKAFGVFVGTREELKESVDRLKDEGAGIEIDLLE